MKLTRNAVHTSNNVSHFYDFDCLWHNCHSQMARE